jgi:hypothetical protein
MQANYSNQSVAVAPSADGDHKREQYIYQAGIIAAILVFLLSFWSF